MEVSDLYHVAGCVNRRGPCASWINSGMRSVALGAATSPSRVRVVWSFDVEGDPERKPLDRSEDGHFEYKTSRMGSSGKPLGESARPAKGKSLHVARAFSALDKADIGAELYPAFRRGSQPEA